MAAHDPKLHHRSPTLAWTPHVPSSAVSDKEREQILKSINGEQPWREINEEGEVVDELGEVVDHDYGKDVPGPSNEAMQKALLSEAAAASKERAEMREALASLSRDVASMAVKLDRLARTRKPTREEED